jgi:hypothetical protein
MCERGDMAGGLCFAVSEVLSFGLLGSLLVMIFYYS